MTAEVKIRTLAQQSSELMAIFGEPSGLFRWFDTRLEPNYLRIGKTCARVRRVSTLRQYAHEMSTAQGVSRQSQPRFQIDVLDYDAERARTAAAAIRNWLATVDFSSNAQFASPITSPTRHPNFVLNQRADMFPDVDPPAYVQTLDVRIFDLEEE